MHALDNMTVTCREILKLKLKILFASCNCSSGLNKMSSCKGQNFLSLAEANLWMVG